MPQPILAVGVDPAKRVHRAVAVRFPDEVVCDIELPNALDAHCQVNRCGGVCGQSDGGSEPSRCLVDAGLLPPNLERPRANASIAGCGHEMAPRPEVSVDHRVRPQEPLRLAG